MNIRLKDLTGTANPSEYFPVNGQSAYYLPPDILFAPDWVERAAIAPTERGGGYNRNKQYGHQLHNSAGHSSMYNVGGGSSIEFYTGDLPGFVVCAATPVVEEMFRRSLFGLPPQMHDVAIHPNVPLFVFDSQATLMLGIFYVDSPVG
jgi:hypothetical protein